MTNAPVLRAHAAFKKTLDLVEVRMELLGKDRLGEHDWLTLSHFEEMEKALGRMTFDSHKANRWLGWLQGVGMAAGLLTGAECSQINKEEAL